MKMNTWMNNPQYLAQVGHALGGLSLMLLTMLFSHSMFAVSAMFAAGLAAAAVKEFWYDAKYEIPKQTAADNWMDFGFYSLGGLLGFGLSALSTLV